MRAKHKADVAPAQSGQHTPGPWEARDSWPFPDDAGRTFSAVIKRFQRHGYKDEALICSFEHSVFRDNSTANARLIAAAPELLARLDELCAAIKPYAKEWVKNQGKHGDALDSLDNARAVIAKAKGGKQ